MHATYSLHVLKESPLNAEPDLKTLIAHEITPIELVYSRNHSDIKELDAEEFKLTIDGLGISPPLEFSLADLKSKFESQTVVAAMQCAGNRTKHMSEVTRKEVDGIMWSETAIANIRWTGVALRDLLCAAGLQQSESRHAGMHVQFMSHVAECEDDKAYDVSIPLERAFGSAYKVLLAFAMNDADAPLPKAHGYPFRIVVPGVSGVRWVKWVDRITIVDRESTGHYQQHDYKALPPSIESREQASREQAFENTPAMQAHSLNSVITSVSFLPDMKRSSGEPHGHKALVRGYAIRDGNLESGQVAAVEISADEGGTWQPAHIVYQHGAWSWSLFQGTINISPYDKYSIKIWSRATDLSGQQQHIQCDWNLRGVAYDGVGQMTVDVPEGA